MTQVIAVSAGLPRAGASTFAVAFALELAGRGYKACLIDIEAALFPQPAQALSALVSGEAELEQVIQSVAPGFDYLPGGVSANAFVQLETEQLGRLGQQLSRLPEYDYLIVDAASGHERNRLALLEAADTLIAVGAPDSGLLTHTYELIKRLNQHGSAANLWLLINRCRSHTIGWHAYGRLREVTDFYLSLRLPLLDIVREVEVLPATGTAGLRPLFAAPSLREDVARCVDRLCSGELGQAAGSLPDYWTRFLRAADVPLSLLDSRSSQPESGTGAVDTAVPEPIEETPAALAIDLGSNRQPVRDARYWLAAVPHQRESSPADGCETFRVQQPTGRVVTCVWFAPPA